jgi:hypothetical protein
MLGAYKILSQAEPCLNKSALGISSGAETLLNQSISLHGSRSQPAANPPPILQEGPEFRGGSADTRHRGNGTIIIKIHFRNCATLYPPNRLSRKGPGCTERFFSSLMTFAKMTRRAKKIALKQYKRSGGQITLVVT